MIDVVLATYNGERYLAEQIRSIQKCIGYDQFIKRLIVVDDGSSDTTALIVKQLSLNDDKIGWLRNTSGQHGPSNNFSFGLTQTKSQYIMLSDQDDVWLPEKIQVSINQIKCLEKQSGDMPLLVFSDKEIVDDALHRICPSYFTLKKIPKDWHLKFEQLCQQNVASGCTMLFNRALLEIALPIPKQAYMHDWWLALIASRCGRIALIDAPLIKYRQHANNTIGANKRSKLNLLTRFNRHLKQFENSFLLTVEQAKAMVFFEQSNQLKENETINYLSNIHDLSKGQLIGLFVKKTITRSHFLGRIALLFVLLKIKKR